MVYLGIKISQSAQECFQNWFSLYKPKYCANISNLHFNCFEELGKKLDHGNPILNDLNDLMDELIDVQLLLTEKLQSYRYSS